jgi:hypothetical protein
MKRGMEAHAYMKDKEVKIDIPGWAYVLLSITALAYFFVSFSIEYTFGRVIPTLIMIESPQDISFEPIPTEDTDATKTKDPEHQGVRRQTFITSSFRSAILLLKSKGGFKARYRGLSIFIVNAIAVQWIAGFLSMLPLLRSLPLGVTAVAATVICAQLSLGWTHIVISEPSPKAWFRRIPTLKMWKKVAGPTAMLGVAEQLAVMLPLYLAINTGLTKDPKEFAELPDRIQKAAIIKSIGIFALGLVLAFLVVIPANVTLTRVQASLLHDEHDTIVPFDRSFGGKVVPEIVGGTGKISILEAWMTFNMAARFRLVKAYLKVFAMQVGVIVLFSVVFVAQILMIGGVHKIIVPADGKN